MAMMFGAGMVRSAGAQGCISMAVYTDSPGSFCFDLMPKPSANTGVACVSSSEDASCCNGGNEWNFKPTTDSKCGSLMGVPTADSPIPR